MKRILTIILAASVAAISLSAQENEKKQYLPEEGDWAIGFDAKPVLNFVGNLFNGNTENSFDALGGEPTLSNPTVSIMGKYMLTDRLAIKANVGVAITNSKDAYYVQDDAATLLDPLSDAQVADYKNNRRTGVSLLAGVEYRIGKKRVQGVFGGGLLLGVSNQVIKYSYGNEMTVINQRPTVSDHFYDVYDEASYRTIKEYNAIPTITAGLVGTAGVECFVAPKIALGAEVSLYAGYSIRQQTYTLSEGYNTSTELIEQKTDLKSPMMGSFSLATENLGGSVYLAFYF